MLNEEERISRTEKLIGTKAVEKLRNSKVAVFGLGGVGSACTEALARSGIGSLFICDNDTVSVSNLNRQLLATIQSIGRKKTEVMKERIESISPFTRVICSDMFFLPDKASEIDFSMFDYVVDAIDTVSGKLEIINQCFSLSIPVISCMATGNRLDPTRFRICDISETSGDGLARVMRRELRKRNILHVPVVFSDEQSCINPEDRIPGSMSFVPPAAGMIMASKVIRDLVSSEK